MTMPKQTDQKAPTPSKPMTAADHRRWREGMSRWHRETDKRAEQHGCFDPDDDCC
jgi:hypothetical protein